MISLFKKEKKVTNDKRRYVRMATIIPVDAKLIHKHSGQSVTSTLQCFSSDISRGGICIQISSPSDDLVLLLEQKEDYKFSLIIAPPFSKHGITAFANIAWAKLIEEHGVKKLVVGLSYEHIIEEDRKRLFAYVSYLRRRPYEIGAVILVLVLFGLYISFNYFTSYQQNQALEQNVSDLKQSGSQHKAAIDQLKQKQAELQTQIKASEQQKVKLEKELQSLAENKTDESTETLLATLKTENHTLNQTLKKLNQELKEARESLISLENKEFFIHVSGTSQPSRFPLDKTIDIITLNNDNVMSGHIFDQDPQKLKVLLLDGTEALVFQTEIKNITSVLISDKAPSGLLQGQNDQLELTRRSTDVDFLRKIQFDTFKYFLNEAHPQTGLVRDTSDSRSPANIAVTGFSLIAHCLAADKGWLTHDDAYQYTLKTLSFLMQMNHKEGFFYRFVDMSTGKRAWHSEVSSMDTAVLAAGALFAGQYFANTEVTRLAQSLYERINWPWMTNDKNALCMGWNPETGFLPYYWDSFSEGLFAYIMAIGSPSYPLAKHFWQAIKRPQGSYKDFQFIYSDVGSLFVYQYPLAFVDFRQLSDQGVNYWSNAQQAVLANRQFCIDQQDEFRTYSDTSWGLTASLGPNGYKAYGGKPGIVTQDGTVSPAAVAASLPLAPHESLETLKAMYDTYEQRLYGFYGFRDAYNIDRSWFAKNYVGLNQGLVLLMIENYLSEFVWKHVMELDSIKRWEDIALTND